MMVKLRLVSEIKKIIKNYDKKFLLRLISWGDADMINFYNENNHFVLPLAASKKPARVIFISSKKMELQHDFTLFIDA